MVCVFVCLISMFVLSVFCVCPCLVMFVSVCLLFLCVCSVCVSGCVFV